LCPFVCWTVQTWATLAPRTAKLEYADAGSLVILDTYTGKFDNIGAFTEPSQFQMHMQIGYAATSRVQYTINLQNIVDTCFGGSKEPWTISNNHACGYGTVPGLYRLSATSTIQALRSKRS
jgi:hypothetical protein